MDLLSIAPPTPEFDRAVLDAPGGFVWWYTDIIDADGNGLVLIWSFGLPFLPGYASAARAGRAELPASRPSLNVAVFERGRLACYLLHEFEPEDAQWDGSRWEFGGSTFETGVAGGRRTLRASLDCPLPGGQRLSGEVALEGVARGAGPADAARLVHDWAPLCGPAQAVATLRAGDRAYELRGRGYLDGNAGAAPLHDAGIAAWTWGRVARPDRESIYYVLWRELDGAPESYGVEIDEHGVLESFEIDAVIGAQRRGVAGLRYPAELSLQRDGESWLQVRATDVLDDGPFYVRTLLESADGARGIGELCRTDRIDLERHRPLVQMRVQRADGRNSMWLPLFAGPREGRVRRLLAQLRS